MAIEDDIKQKKFKNEYSKVIVNLLFTTSWVQEQHALLFKPFGITAPQYNVLRILRGQNNKPATINLIIDRMIDRMSNASRIVDRLEYKGLVERKTCPKDRRAVDVLITPKGMDYLAELDIALAEFEKKLAAMPENEVSQLNDLMDKLREAPLLNK